MICEDVLHIFDCTNEQVRFNYTATARKNSEENVGLSTGGIGATGRKLFSIFILLIFS